MNTNSKLAVAQKSKIMGHTLSAINEDYDQSCVYAQDGDYHSDVITNAHFSSAEPDHYQLTEKGGIHHE